MKLIEKSKKVFVAFVAAGIVMGPQAGFAQGTVVVNGAGATFPAPIYTKWFSVYHDAHPDVEINYQAIGSGGGIKQVTAHTVDFGATDGPDDDTQLWNSAGEAPISTSPPFWGAWCPSSISMGSRPEILRRRAGEYLPRENHHVE